jgi:uncharacterized protein YukE
MPTVTQARFAGAEASMRGLDQKLESLQTRIRAHEDRMAEVDRRQSFLLKSKATSELKISEEREFGKLTDEAARLRREIELFKTERKIIQGEREPIADAYMQLSKELEHEQDQAELQRLIEIVNEKSHARTKAQIALGEALAAEQDARFNYEIKSDAIQAVRREEARQKQFATLQPVAAA